MRKMIKCRNYDLLSAVVQISALGKALNARGFSRGHLNFRGPISVQQQIRGHNFYSITWPFYSLDILN